MIASPDLRRLGFIAVLLLALGCKGEDLLPTAPAMPAPPPPPEDPAPTILARATFRDANDYRTAGTAVLEQTADGQVLRLGEDFETERSNALDVRLCERRRCGGDDLVLGGLQSFSGAQSYVVTGDGSGYDFVVIWCRAVELSFGTGRLE